MRLIPAEAPLKLGYGPIRESVRERCALPRGRELLDELTPSADPDTVRLRLARTAEWMDHLRFGDALPWPELPDIRPALQRARPEGTVLDADALLRVWQTAFAARRTQAWFRTRADRYPQVAAVTAGLVPLKPLEEAILEVLTDTGLVRDNASPELGRIRRSLVTRRQDLRAVLQRIQRQASKDGILAESEPSLRNGRMVLAVRAEHKRHLAGFIHDTSATGQTVYLEPAEVLHINNDIRSLEAEELREIDRLLRILTALVREHRAALDRNQQLLGELDLMRAIAKRCVDWDGFPTEIARDDRIILIRARNPNLTADVVPLDLALEPDERGLIITGPNAGGKSVALKTVGLAVYLSQCGFAFPAAEGSRLPVYTGLNVDLGDDQSIENDLSTFSGRLTWIREVVGGSSLVVRGETQQTTTHKRLTLIDEAASGTDPEEGTALYQALMEQLLERGDRLVVTTHHGALKVYAHARAGLVNGSMEFDTAALKPTYRFRKGIPGSSYAFEIARRIGVPQSVTDTARGLLGGQRDQLESLIAAFERDATAARDKSLELDQRLRESETLARTYREKLEGLTRERDRIRAKTLRQLEDMVTDAARTIERTVEELRASGAGKAAIKKAREAVRSLESGVHSQNPDEPVLADEPEPVAVKSDPKPQTLNPKLKEWVRLKGTESEGELLEIDGKTAYVSINGLRVKTPLKNLEPTVGKPKTEDRKPVTVVLNFDPTADALPRTTLDLRGKRGDAAMAELERFLDRAVAAGLGTVDILHGKGDGILRNLTRQYLQKRPGILAYDDAPWDHGGPGVTVVRM